ncbi:MAG: chemotaxis protein CheW [Desulfobacterales bacterium]|nr:chemotaxis protein CheW [Desulfobacterales bacterium]
MDTALLEDFIQDGLSLLDEALDQIHLEGCDHAGVNAIFRCLHTLKGASAYFEIDALSRFVHQFEETLKKLQEGQKGLSSDEGSKIMEGLVLTQEALINAKEISFAEKAEYKAYLESLQKLHYRPDIVQISEIETLIQQIKHYPTQSIEQTYQKQLFSVSKLLTKVIKHEKSEIKPVTIAVSSSSIQRVMLNDEDITAPCHRVLDALEAIAKIGKNALSRFDRSGLDADLLFVAKKMNRTGMVLGFDIIEDLYDISPEVIHEAFRRFWIDGVSQFCTVELAQEDTSPPPENTSCEQITSSSIDSELAQLGAEEKTEEKAEEYLRISSGVLHRMTEQAGELVADRNALEFLIQEMGSHLPARYRGYLKDNYTNLDQHVNRLERELSYLSNRQLNDVFNRLPALVKKLETDLGKKADLSISGGEIEIPRDLIRALNDPLIHIIRNAMDHAIEMPEDRLKQGKFAEGKITIEAVRDEDRLCIRIQDDGRGLDRQRVIQKAIDKGLIDSGVELNDQDIVDLILRPGFSTASQVTDVSGRGVGMDVVNNAIRSRGGRVHMSFREGMGTQIELSLPLEEGHRTRDVLLVVSGNMTFGIEYYCLRKILNISEIAVHSHQQGVFFLYQNRLIPYINLEELFTEKTDNTYSRKRLGKVLVIEDEQQREVGCRVDKVLRKVKVVVNPFSHEFLKENPLVRGSAVLGTGAPYLILDFRNISDIVDSVV